MVTQCLLTVKVCVCVCVRVRVYVSLYVSVSVCVCTCEKVCTSDKLSPFEQITVLVLIT